MGERQGLAKHLRGRAEAHEKHCSSTMSLGFFSGIDARLMRDAADMLDPAQTRRAPGDLDPAEIWYDYIEEVPYDDRSPQGALAFGFWAAYNALRAPEVAEAGAIEDRATVGGEK